MRQNKQLKTALEKHLQLIFINAFINDTRIANILELKEANVPRQFAESLAKNPYGQAPISHNYIEAYREAYKEADICLMTFQPKSHQKITDTLARKVNETFQRKEDKAYFQE